MLIRELKEGETLVILPSSGEKIVVCLARVTRRGRAKVGIEAPVPVKIVPGKKAEAAGRSA